MNVYLLSVMGTVLFCSLLTAILPDGKTTNTVKGIAKLTCLLIIISPIFNFLSVFTNSDENSSVFFEKNGIVEDKEFIMYYQELQIQEATQKLESELEDKFGIVSTVCLIWESVEDNSNVNEKIKINQIQIKVPIETGDDMKNSIFIFIKNNYCSEVLIE